MKTYAKLLGKCVAVMAPLIVLCIYFSQHIMAFIDGEGPYYMWNRETVTSPHEEYYDVVILGDSLANAAYMPEVLSDSTINISLGGSSPVENYLTLRDWLKNNKAPKVCYISFGEGHFLNADWFWKRGMYSHRFSFAQGLEVLKNAKKYNEENILTEHYILDLLSYELWLPNKYITAFLHAGFNQRGASNSNGWASVDLHRGRYIGNTTKVYLPDSPPTLSDFSTNPMLDVYYRKIIELCRENDIQVRLIRIPLPDNWVIKDSYIDAFDSYYDELRSTYPGITTDCVTLADRTYFLDAQHMNSYGALVYSTKLRNMYPEDFGDGSLSAGQTAGINDYIRQEVSLDHIFDWIAGCGYTALLYDARGLVPELYGEQIDTVVSDVPLAVTPLDGDGIYTVTDGEETDVTVTQAEDGTLMVQIAGGEPAPWTVKPGADIGVLVIDSLGRTACAKSFDYTDGPELALMS